VPDCQSGQVLGPNASAELRVVVKDAAGAPMKQHGVLFVAPDGGATGAFANPDPLGPNYARVRTDDNGGAVVRFTANAQVGGYLVDAVVDDVDAQTTFAVTNTAEVLPPGATAQTARCRVEADPTLFDLNVSDRLVHGPFFLPAGSAVTSLHAQPADPPLVGAGGPLWFFWVDDHRLAAFSHAVRLVTFPASGTEVPPTVIPHDWWPVLTYPNMPSTALLSPGLVNQAPSAALAPAKPKARASSVRVFSRKLHADHLRPLDGPAPPAAGEKVVGMVTLGGPERQFQNMASDMKDFYTDERQVPLVLMKETFVGTPGRSSIQDLSDYIDTAKAEGATKILWFSASHGYVTIPGENPTGSGVLYADGLHSWDELAKLFKTKLEGTNIKLEITVLACFAENAAVAFDGIGLEGEILVSSDRTSYSYMERWWLPDSASYFTDRLISEWSPVTSSTATSLGETYTRMLDYSPLLHPYFDVKLKEPNPKHLILSKTPDAHQVPPIDIPCVNQTVVAELPIPSPPGAEARNGAQEGVVNVLVPAVAVANGAKLLYSPADTTVSKPFTGKSTGSTDYIAVFWIPPAGKFVGINKITVGTCQTPTADAIHAVFTQASFSTSYTVGVTNPSKAPLTVTWAVTGEVPACLDFSPPGTSPPDSTTTQNPNMIWKHPHPPCEGSPSHSTATVTATIEGPTVKIVCTYQGAETGTGQPCVATPK
jgi:hypothetical protein